MGRLSTSSSKKKQIVHHGLFVQYNSSQVKAAFAVSSPLQKTEIGWGQSVEKNEGSSVEGGS
jgi:hypothetical protein